MNRQQRAALRAEARAEGARAVANMARAYPDQLTREQLALLDRLASIIEQEVE